MPRDARGDAGRELRRLWRGRQARFGAEARERRQSQMADAQSPRA
jgi:hypothetical protein